MSDFYQHTSYTIPEDRHMAAVACASRDDAEEAHLSIYLTGLGSLVLRGSWDALERFAADVVDAVAIGYKTAHLSDLMSDQAAAALADAISGDVAVWEHDTGAEPPELLHNGAQDVKWCAERYTGGVREFVVPQA